MSTEISELIVQIRELEGRVPSELAARFAENRKKFE